MRILHVWKSYYNQSKGGIEKAIQQLTASTSAMGVANTVLCIESGNRSLKNTRSGKKISSDNQEHEPRIVACRSSLEFDSIALSLSMFPKFKALIREHDLVHYHFPFPQQDMMHLLIKPEIPTLITYRSDIVRQRFLYGFYRPLQDKFLAGVDAIVATSENYLVSSPVLRVFKDKVSIIPIGLDEQTYPGVRDEVIDKWRSRLGMGFFLFIGVLRYYKGLDILLKAASMCDQRFVIAGTGPMEKELQHKAGILGLENVHFLGPVSEEDKVALFRLCRSVVFPSHLRSEAFGLTLLEGAMFAKPLISAEIGTGTSYINKHGITGLVIPKSDPRALCEAVKILDKNRDMAVKMGQNARNRYLELFTATKSAEKYIRLYRKLSTGSYKNICLGNKTK
jgi:glycosyltransferase involved in cell wall biosynthesis